MERFIMVGVDFIESIEEHIMVTSRFQLSFQ